MATSTLVNSSSSTTQANINSLELEQILDEICFNNGINSTNLRIMKQDDTVKSIEMFFNGLPTIVHMDKFPCLKELKIIAQEFHLISGLETCVNLNELWISECKLNKISGLKNCKNLRKIYFYSNRIAKIENLDHLANLEVLWLANNKISKIENLNSLVNLKELNLAKNNISSIGFSLDNLESLEDLNLSANNIDKFEEIANLQSLPNLRSLCFKDPQYGYNPITILCNYSLYIIYHLPNLTFLDTLSVSQKVVKELADSTINKKKLWYFMKLTTIKREMNEIVKKLDTIKEMESKTLKKEINLYISKIKDIIKKQNTRKLQREDKDPTKTSIEDEDDVRMIKTYEENIASNQTKLKIIESQYKIALNQLTQEIEIKKNYNFIELENGGNIRFEFGTPSDIWFKSCSDLILSRFCSSDYILKSISGIKIRHVIRLTNRSLIARYEENLLNEIDENDYINNKPAIRKKVDYLMYCWRPKLGTQLQELYDIIRNGFKDPQTYRKFGFEEAIPFSNSLSVCDHLRIEALKTNQTSKFNANITCKYGYALLCKVYTNKFAQYAKMPNSLDEYSNDASICADAYQGSFGVRRQFSHSSSKASSNQQSMSQDFIDAQRNCDCKAKQNEWFLFNKNLAVPEYIVEFEYINKYNFENYFDLEQYEQKKKEFNQLEQALMSNDSTSSDLDKKIEKTNFLPNEELINKEIEIQLSVLVNSSLDNLVELNLHNLQLTNLECDTFKMLKCLKKLIVSFNKLKSLKEICYISNLEYLDASHNQIDSLSDIKNSTKINYLDLSYNKLNDEVTTNFLLRQFFPMLMQLNLNENMFKKFSKMKPLLIYTLRSLTELNHERIEDSDKETFNYASSSRLNKEIIKRNSYFMSQRPRCLKYNFLTDIFYLDSKNKLISINTPSKILMRSEIEMLNKSRMNSELESLPNQLSSADSRSNSSVSAGSTSEAVSTTSRGSSGSSSSIHREKPMTASNALFNKVTTLVMENQNLFKLTSMDNLVNLKWASFNNNFLTKIEGLEKCTKLEELSFENNLIQTLNGLENLTNLRKLNLNSNEVNSFSISSDNNYNNENIFGDDSKNSSSNEEKFINVFQNLTKLNYLSISNNKLTSIKFLKKLISIVEFYACFNHLNNLRDFFHLKSINSLSILDTSNNPFCNDPRYRLFVVYHLKSMKSLDGSPIEQSEINESRDCFGGKLTCDFIAERIGHSRFDEIKFLDFPQCNIKLIDLSDTSNLIFNINMTNQPKHYELFDNLRSLNLENNNLTSFSGIVNLQNLKILCLNNNRIETIFPRTKQQLQQQQSTSEKPSESSVLPNLEVLHLAFNGISDLVNLQIGKLTSLKALFLQGNELTKIEGIETLRDLRELVLDKNKIKSIGEYSLIGQSQRLLELHIEENRLRDLSNLNNLKYLQKLYVANNKISEFTDFDRIIDLNHLQELSLINNPVSRRAHYRITVVYRLRRVKVLDMTEISDEDRMKAEIYFSEQQQLQQQAYFNGTLIQTAPMIGSLLTTTTAATANSSNLNQTSANFLQAQSNQITLSQYENQLITGNYSQSPRNRQTSIVYDKSQQQQQQQQQSQQQQMYGSLSQGNNIISSTSKLLKMKNQYDKMAKDMQNRYNGKN